MHMFTITKQLEHLHELKEQTLSEEKGLGGADCMCTLFSAASVSEGLFFLKK